MGIVTNNPDRSGCFVSAIARSGNLGGARTNSINTPVSRGVNFNASGSNKLYGSSTTVTPNSLVVGFYIKYL